MEHKAMQLCKALAVGFALSGLILIANAKPVIAQNGHWQNGPTTYTPDPGSATDPYYNGDNGYECAAGVSYDASTQQQTGVFDQGYNITWEIKYVLDFSPYPATGYTITASAEADATVAPYGTTAATDDASAEVDGYTKASVTNVGDDDEPYGPQFVATSHPTPGSIPVNGRIHASANAGPDYTGDPNQENPQQGSSAAASASAGLNIINSTANPPVGPPPS